MMETLANETVPLQSLVGQTAIVTLIIGEWRFTVDRGGDHSGLKQGEVPVTLGPQLKNHPTASKRFLSPIKWMIFMELCPRFTHTHALYAYAC